MRRARAFDTCVAWSESTHRDRLACAHRLRPRRPRKGRGCGGAEGPVVPTWYAGLSAALQCTAGAGLPPHRRAVWSTRARRCWCPPSTTRCALRIVTRASRPTALSVPCTAAGCTTLCKARCVLRCSIGRRATSSCTSALTASVDYQARATHYSHSYPRPAACRVCHALCRGAWHCVRHAGAPSFCRRRGVCALQGRAPSAARSSGVQIRCVPDGSADSGGCTSIFSVQLIPPTARRASSRRTRSAADPSDC